MEINVRRRDFERKRYQNNDLIAHFILSTRGISGVSITKRTHDQCSNIRRALRLDVECQGYDNVPASRLEDVYDSLSKFEHSHPNTHPSFEIVTPSVLDEVVDDEHAEEKNNRLECLKS